jgi:hypothetical protein
MSLPQWTAVSGTSLGTIDERSNTAIDLPLADTTGTTVSLIAGELPPGLRISGFQIIGVPFEVNRTKTFEFTIRATTLAGVLDRTFSITVEGADAPEWITPAGPLNIGAVPSLDYWLDIQNTNFGLNKSNGVAWEPQTVDTYDGIPSNREGSDGDYAFDLQTNQYFEKISGRWYKLNSTTIKSVLGSTVDVVSSLSVPDPINNEYWLNANESLGGLDLRLRQFSESQEAWLPVDYVVSFTAPVDPGDQQLWVELIPDNLRFSLKKWNLSEMQWEELFYEYTNVPPDRASTAYFVLDSSFVDFQLQAIDSDLATGVNLEFYIADGDGELPPGLTLQSDGRISGIVEPILSLDKDAEPGYDVGIYDRFPLDFSVVDNDGFDSYLYDTQFYGFSDKTRIPKKLNRYYNFAVTVADDVGEIKREFQIYLVGDDFLRADNTIMKAATGLFTADVTYLRKPVWLTPGYLGAKRADNYQTIYLDVYDPNTLLGVITYILRQTNDDGTPSLLPPGLELDNTTGELVGTVPYQPAVTKQYRFTIEAQRSESDIDVAEIFFNIFEDTVSGKTTLRVFKLPLGLDDGLDDLNSLVNRSINIENNFYTVTATDDSNEDYDIIELDRGLEPTYRAKPITLERDVLPGASIIYGSYESLAQEIDRDFYYGKQFKYSSVNVLEIKPKTTDGENNNTIEPFVAWTVSTTDPDALLEFNYDTAEIEQLPGDTFASAVQRYVLEKLIKPSLLTTDSDKYSEADVRVEVLSQSSIEIYAPETNLTLSRNKVKEAFHSNDSSSVDVIRGATDSTEGRFFRILLNAAYPATIAKNSQISLGVPGETTIVERINVANNEVVSAIKTFTVDILGEVESAITWITPTDLGVFSAGRPSYFKLVAETSLEGGNIKYDLIGGKLPNGLELKKDGEIVGRAEQFGEQNVYKSTWRSDRSYNTGDIVVYNEQKYKAVADIVPGSDETILADTNFFVTFEYSRLGLTTFDSREITIDESNTSFDRQFTFKVLARDRYGYSARAKEFTLSINDIDQNIYTNLYMKPFLKQNQRDYFASLVNNFTIFEPEYIYRPYDPDFGIQKELKSLAYAGIEQKRLENFVTAVAKNHKKKNFVFGDLKIAQARQPGSNDVIYELVYVELKDLQEPTAGVIDSVKNIKTKETIKINQVDIEIQDDDSNINAGLAFFEIATRDIEEPIIRIRSSNNVLTVVKRNGDSADIPAAGVITIVNRNGQNVNIISTTVVNNSSPLPMRFRPISQTISIDSDAVGVGNTVDRYRYISNISNMRKRIAAIGVSEREFLPLWMRTSQEGNIQEIDYTLAVPLCYVKPGSAQRIKENIEQSNFDFKNINYEIDRYIVDATEDNQNQQYILFPNYKFNV